MKLFIKLKIFFDKITKSFRQFFKELFEEFSMIARNRNYSKKHPNLFAIFTILEQEQNSQIFILQKDNFEKIKNNILKDSEVSNHHILEALRGIYHNNKFLSNQDFIKDKIVKYIFEKTKKFIDKTFFVY